MELLAARFARVQDDEDFAWIVAGKQDEPGQGEATILPAAGNFKGQALTNAIVFTDTFAVVAGELARQPATLAIGNPRPLTP